MLQLPTEITAYLYYCACEKNLGSHTLRAYKTDLHQFSEHCEKTNFVLDRSCISGYISLLHAKYKPKSVK